MLPSFNRQGGTVFGLRVEFRQLSEDERRRNDGTISDFVYVGRVDGGSLELWKENGRWREDDRPHHLDLAMVAAHKGRTL